MTVLLGCIVDDFTGGTDLAGMRTVQQQQVQAQVGLADFSVVEKGAAAIAQRFVQLRGQGCRFAVVDAVSNRDLEAIGATCADLKLITGGSGIALGLPQNFRQRGQRAPLASGQAGQLAPPSGFRAVISGSCSVATQQQVAHLREPAPAFHVDPLQLAEVGPVVSGSSLEAAVYAAEELEETAKLFLLLRDVPTRPLDAEQIADLKHTFKLDI